MHVLLEEAPYVNTWYIKKDYRQNNDEERQRNRIINCFSFMQLAKLETLKIEYKRKIFICYPAKIEHEHENYCVDIG